MPLGTGAYFEAYLELLSERPEGVTRWQIPFTTLDCYARRFGIDDPDEFRLLLAVVRALEAEAEQIRDEMKTEPEEPPQ